MDDKATLNVSLHPLCWDKIRCLRNYGDWRTCNATLTWRREMAVSEDISRQAVNYQDANNVDKHLLHAVVISSLLLANTSHQISVSSNNHNQFQRALFSHYW